MRKRIMMATAATVAGLALVVQSAEAAYTDSAAWLAQLQAEPSQTLAAFPSYSLVTQDAFGTTGPTQVNTTGQWTGNYGCNSLIYPCSGAYRLTYTLPFNIIGFEGNLLYTQAYGLETPIFSVPFTQSSPSTPEFDGYSNGYSGFYGDFFGATNTITLVWQAGLTSYDDYGTFTLSSAEIVLAPVPEPASLILLGSCLLGCAGLSRRGPASARREQAG